MQISLIFRSGFWLSLCLIAFGCSSVLGIEDARCDPKLPACKGTDALCNTYCNTVYSACVGELAQYTSLQNCQKVCANLPPGQVGDDMVNTVQCRLAQANLAAALSPQDKAIYCPGAGPGGNGLCGENCEGACTIITQACVGKYQVFMGDINACETSCQAIPDQHTFNSTDATMSEGNTVQCRIWHASAAAESNNLHCGHASGLSPCDEGN
jgi:hypothetical protein